MRQLIRLSEDIVDRTNTHHSLSLPPLPEGLESALRRGHTLQVEGTNVVRVPFGVRQPRKNRPSRPDHWATLVIPIQPTGGSTPPPAAA